MKNRLAIFKSLKKSVSKNLDCVESFETILLDPEVDSLRQRIYKKMVLLDGDYDNVSIICLVGQITQLENMTLPRRQDFFILFRELVQNVLEIEFFNNVGFAKFKELFEKFAKMYTEVVANDDALV